MKKLYLLFIVIFAYSFSVNAQDSGDSKDKQIFTKPKLVVGIVVDQMRHDYLIRFWDRYGDDGFKRMINDGFIMKNAHYNYVPTYTAPGHASVYTGTSPRFHGVISNNWYDKTIGESVYCAGDDSVNPIGTKSEAGKMSPHRLLATTVSDQNRLATQFKGKTIGIALKDRGAIMPAGHSANGAYWFRGKDEGNFITSSYYMDKLPKWASDFNKSRKIDQYLKTWETLYPISTYEESGSDKNDFEAGLGKDKKTTFPYDLAKISAEKKENKYEIIYSTPFGNNLTTDFALAAIEGEELGKDEITDFLTISYSSPDYIGHNFGVNSKEVQDNYLRLDQEIARLLNELDKKVGKGEYTVFLTADHAAVQVPAYLQSKKIASGYFEAKLKKDLDSLVEQKFGSANLIENLSNRQLFFNYKKLEERRIGANELADVLGHFLVNYPQIAQAYTREMIEGSGFNGMIARRIKNGFNPKRSGDVVYELEPAIISYPKTGSTHGSPYKYDTHIPMVFYGMGINNGQSTNHAEIIDIAPTISSMLGIAFPNAAYGTVLSEVID